MQHRPLEEVIDMARWTHNTNVIVSGQIPLQIVREKNLSFPRISNCTTTTESLYEDVGVRQIMKRRQEIVKMSRDQEFEKNWKRQQDKG